MRFVSERVISLGRIFLGVASALVGCLPVGAQEFAAFGPQSYIREAGSPITVTKSFSVLNPATSFTLRIFNGGMTDGEFEKVSSSVISLNGVQVVGPSEFNQNVSYIEKPVVLQAANEIAVTLRGQPGGGITVIIAGIDPDPPSITASISPMPNGDGWNNSDVSVSFTCDDGISGVASCPATVIVTAEGAGQMVQGTAVDRAGNTASASATVNLDRAPPSLIVTSPGVGDVFSAPEVTVAGSVSDSLSGVAFVSCNGVAGSVAGSSFTCPVTLTLGENALTVLAQDLAGNSTSESVTVTFQPESPIPPPVSLEITPVRVTLLVLESKEFEAVDEQGRPRTDVAWSVSDSAVLETAPVNGRTIFRALSPGQAILTGSVGGVSAQAEVTVLAGSSLPPGTIRWSVQPKPGFATARILQAQPSENGPATLTIEGGANGEILIRAFDSDGKFKWESLVAGPFVPPASLAAAGSEEPASSETVQTLISDGPYRDSGLEWSAMPRPASDAAGTSAGAEGEALTAATAVPLPSPPALVTYGAYNDGGILVAFRPADMPIRFTFTSMIRIDGASGNLVWRYDNAGGFIGGGFTGWAVHHDGTIYFGEFTGAVTISGFSSFQVPRDAAASVVALDGETGVARFRLPLPLSRFQHTNLSCAPSQFPTPDPEGASSFGTPMVDEDGIVHLEFLTTDHNWIQSDQGFSPPGICTPLRYEISAQVNLATVQPTGELSWQTLQSLPITGASGLVPVQDRSILQFADVIPDGLGGVLAAWRRVVASEPFRVTRVTSQGVTEYPLPFGGPVLVLGEEGVAFANSSRSVMAFDVATGAVRWSWQPPNQPDGTFTFLHPVTTTAGNGLVVTTQRAGEFPFGLATVVRLDAVGQPNIEAGTGTSLSFSWTGEWNGLANGALASIALPSIPISFKSSWAQPRGNASQNGRAHVHHTLGIFWCGIGFALQGRLPNSPCFQGNGDDIRWGYYPKADGINAIRNFDTDHPEWVGMIETEAIKSFQKAYARYGIQVRNATQHVDFFNNLVPDQEYTVYVLGDHPFDKSGKFFSDSASAVYYFALMEGAQEALGQPADPNTGAGWINFSPAYPPQDPAKFIELLRAMGRAIGNSAAHEIGHQLERLRTIKSNDNLPLPFMDCGLGNDNDPNRPVPIACEGDDNFVYGFFNADGFPQNGGTSRGGMFFYGVPGGTLGVPVQFPIHWGPSQICWLQNYAVPESCKKL